MSASTPGPHWASYRWIYERLVSVWVFHGMIMWWITYSEKMTEITTFKIKHKWKCVPQYFQSCYWEKKYLCLRTVGICKCQCRTLPGDGWELWCWRSLLLTFCLICASWKRESSRDRNGEHISTWHLWSFLYHPARQGSTLPMYSEPCSELISTSYGLGKMLTRGTKKRV